MASRVEPVVELVKRYGPKLGPAIAAVAAFLARNPDLPSRVGDQLRRALKQVVLVRLQRGDAAKTRGNLGIVRESAPRLGGEGGTAADVVAGWLKRADSIEIALQLAAGLSDPERKRRIAELRTRSETLVADVLEAAVED